MKKIALALGATVALAGCATTSVTPISQSQFIISTSAVPACGRTGATSVASKMAAVETLRRGYTRYVILGAGSESNVQMVNTGPTGHQTSGSINGFGGFRTNTTYTGGSVIAFGSHDANLTVQMLRSGDNGYRNGIDAKATLGAEWKTLVEKGIKTCS